MGPKIKFYTDEHIAKAVVRGLRQRDVDLLTVVEAGMLGASDNAWLRVGENEEDIDPLRRNTQKGLPSGSESLYIGHRKAAESVIKV